MGSLFFLGENLHVDGCADEKRLGVLRWLKSFENALDALFTDQEYRRST